MNYTYNDPDHINAVSSISYNGTPYAFTYDPNGNMLTGHDFTNPANIFKRSLTWNADNMPTVIERRSLANNALISSINLTYDGNGARAKKVAGGITTYYVSSDYEIKNGVATKYVFAGNMRVASIEGTNIDNSKIFHKEHLGSSTAVTDNTGADIETTEYMPFGVQRSHSGANASDYKYTDQELDNESGLYNYDARMYDPVIGRFISTDVLVQDWYDPQALNRLSYCRNNPLKYIDPSGHEFINEVIEGDFNDTGTTWTGIGGSIGVGLIPIVGQIADLRDTIANGKNVWENPTKGVAWVGLAGAVVAWVPGLGDALKGVFKVGKNVVGSTDEVVEITTSRFARREAMRQEGIPTSRSATSHLGNNNSQLRVEGADGKPKIITQHNADKNHKNPHWHAADPKTDPATGEVLKNNRGQNKYKSGGSTVEYNDGIPEPAPEIQNKLLIREKR
ncbi:MAG: RHS repeat-associated core domain-containing protein [Desulfatiglans sp.]|nr:RHS repeat-associated core domain-containing protein [Desulfatiglans sp.]